IDGGGDIVAGDAPPGEDSWTIALPHSKKTSQSKPVIVTLANEAIATSGNLFQFIKLDGVKYSHIIDPATGLGSTTPIKVSVVAPTGTLEDALGSAVSVLGQKKGVAYIEKKEDVAVYIEVNDVGTIRKYQSDNFSDYIIKQP